jgi:hypothetical protein
MPAATLGPFIQERFGQSWPIRVCLCGMWGKNPLEMIGSSDPTVSHSHSQLAVSLLYRTVTYDYAHPSGTYPLYSDLKEIKHFLASNPQHWDGRSSMTGWDSLQLASFSTVTIVQMEYKPRR